MKSIFTKILICVFILGIFLAPVKSIFIELHNNNLNVNLQIKKAEAQFLNGWSAVNPLLGVANTLSDNSTGKEILADSKYGCGPHPATWFTNCVGLLLFEIVFKPLSFIFAQVGRLFDFFLFYSVSHQAYTSEYISKAWGAVRDISNIVFLVALLYIAVKTVLSMNVSNNKKLLGWIIVMALLINFSLFTTRVVIDASNILARVFYNEIVVVSKSGTATQNENGEKKISESLVKIYNPQRIINQQPKDVIATFILITIMAIIVTCVSIYVFLSVAFLFIARVIGLWVAMIFSPFAFASRTISFNIPGLGWREWSSNLMKYAFMAPIFIFFLYIIALLADSFDALLIFNNSNAITDGAGTTIGQEFNMFMEILIPFLILITMLLRARKLAVQYSGEIGQTVMSAVKMGAGIAGGAAMGAVAFGGTRVLGGMAQARMASKGEQLKETAKQGGVSGYFARMQLKALDYGSKATFDARQTVASNKLSKFAGLNFQSVKAIGLESKVGGKTGADTRATQKLEKEAELYKTKMSDDEVKAWSSERMNKYYEDRNTAIKEGKLEEFEKNTQKPTEYKNARDLNLDRMKAFQENIGHNGLMGSLIYSGLNSKGLIVDNKNFSSSKDYESLYKETKFKEERQKALNEFRSKPENDGKPFNEKEFLDNFNAGFNVEYDDKIAKMINKDRINGVKVAVGSVAGLVTGGVLAGGFASQVGGLAGAGMSLSTGFSVAEQAAKKFGKTVEKEHKEMKKIQDRIDSHEYIGKEQQALKKEAENMGLTSGDSGRIDRNKVLSEISIKESEKISYETSYKEALAEATAKGLNPNMDINSIDPKDPDLITKRALLNKVKNTKSSLAGVVTDINKLKSMENLEEKIASNNNTIARLKDQEHNAHPAHKSGDEKLNVFSGKHEHEKIDSGTTEHNAEEHHGGEGESGHGHN